MKESRNFNDGIEKRGFTFPSEMKASPNDCHRICRRKEPEAFKRQTCKPDFQREEIVLEPWQPTIEALRQLGWENNVCPPVTPAKVDYFEFEDNVYC